MFEDTGAGRSCQTDWACFSPEWCLERLERAHERGAFCGGKGPLDSFLEQAQAFYRKYGFVPLQDNPLHLFLPVATIADAFGEED